MTKCKRISFLIVSISIIILSFFGGGLLNAKNFQNLAKRECKQILIKYFAERGEKIKNIQPPDYSLGNIETIVETQEKSYNAVLGISGPWYIEYTSMNYFVKPNVKIVSIEERSKRGL